MHEKRLQTADELAAQLLLSLDTLAKRGSIDQATATFDAPEALAAMRELGLGESSLGLGDQLAVAITKSVSELSPKDGKAAEIILGLAPETRGQRIGERREKAAKVLGVSSGTFRNRHEARLLNLLAKRVAVYLLSVSRVPLEPAAAAMPRATSEEAFGFWSYVRDDDTGDGGRVLGLATDLRTQYRMQTAEELELFVDQESTQWGEEWEKLISDAIAGTTFFIPIITPSYFRSNACRQELLKFVREADKAGLSRLLMPVYWITVPALENEGAESSDEAIRAIAKHQWRDMRDIRFEDRTSSAYRKAVSALAEAIADRASEVANSIEDAPLEMDQPAHSSVVESEEDGLGFLERLAEGDEALEALTALMATIGDDIELTGEIAGRANDQLQEAQVRGQGMKRALTITEKFARDLDTPATRIEEQGQRYAELLVRLDSGLQTRFELLREQDDPFTEEQIDYLDQLEGMTDAADSGLTALQELIETIEPLAKVSRSLRAPVRKMRGGLQGIVDGRALMTEWGEQARALKPQ